MSEALIDELRLVVATFDKETLHTKFVSARFAELIGSETEEIAQFFDNNDDKTNFKDCLLNYSEKQPCKFVTSLRDGRIRMSVEFVINRHSTGDLLVVGTDITERK